MIPLQKKVKDFYWISSKFHPVLALAYANLDFLNKTKVPLKKPSKLRTKVET